MDLITLRTAIERAWTATTTYCPGEWEDQDPAWGQCAVTSVRVAESFGGDLMQGTASLPSGVTTRHYWNRVAGLPLDLTWRQFPAGTQLMDAETASREVLIANRWMEARYGELQANVRRELAGMASESRGPARLAG
jgi:hypothetical protein